MPSVRRLWAVYSVNGSPAPNCANSPAPTEDLAEQPGTTPAGGFAAFNCNSATGCVGGPRRVACAVTNTGSTSASWLVEQGSGNNCTKGECLAVLSVRLPPASYTNVCFDLTPCRLLAREPRPHWLLGQRAVILRQRAVYGLKRQLDCINKTSPSQRCTVHCVGQEQRDRRLRLHLQQLPHGGQHACDVLVKTSVLEYDCTLGRLSHIPLLTRSHQRLHFSRPQPPHRDTGLQ